MVGSSSDNGWGLRKLSDLETVVFNSRECNHASSREAMHHFSKNCEIRGIARPLEDQFSANARSSVSFKIAESNTSHEES